MFQISIQKFQGDRESENTKNINDRQTVYLPITSVILYRDSSFSSIASARTEFEALSFKPNKCI